MTTASFHTDDTTQGLTANCHFHVASGLRNLNANLRGKRISHLALSYKSTDFGTNNDLAAKWLTNKDDNRNPKIQQLQPMFPLIF